MDYAHYVTIHGITGFLYDGTIDGLRNALERVSRLPASELARIGAQAWIEHRDQTCSNVSIRLFQVFQGI